MSWFIEILVSFLLGFLCCYFFFPHVITTTALSSSSSSKPIDSDQSSTTRGPHKLLLAVNTSLKMGKGKIAAQVGHASVGAYERCGKTNPGILASWSRYGAKKIAVKIPNDVEMEALAKSAQALGICTYLVRDAGHTQVCIFITLCFFFRFFK